MSTKNNIKKYFEIKEQIKELQEEQQELLTEIINSGDLEPNKKNTNFNCTYICTFGTHFDKEKFYKKFGVGEKEYKECFSLNSKPSEFLK